MTRSNKNARKAPKPGDQPVSAPFSRRVLLWLLHPQRLLIYLLAAAVWWKLPALRQYLPEPGDDPAYQVTTADITVTTPPRWIPEDFADQVFARAGFHEPLSLHERTLAEKIGLAFATHPWVEELRSVTKSYPAGVRVELVYRRPVAMVSVVGGYLPIDRHGVLLPTADFSPSDLERYPLIQDVVSVPAGTVGQPWGDPAVAGAAQIAELLHEPIRENGPTYWSALRLKSIHVPRTVAMPDEFDRLQFYLETPAGSRILWGRAPASQHPGELAAATKLQRIVDYFRDQGGFDDGPARWEIDIRTWGPIQRVALKPDSSPRH